MNMLTPAKLSLVLLATMSGLAYSAELPPRDEYAYGFALAVQGSSEYFSVSVPLEVYGSVFDASLRDAGVYNADGHAVPRKFEHQIADEASIEKRVSLALVPFYGLEADQPDQLRFLLHSDDSGITLDLDAGGANQKNTNIRDGSKPPTSYIIDFRKLEHAVETLEFEWPDLPDGFMGTVQLEDSVDLQYWRKLGSSTLAELQHEGALIEQRRVKLSKKVTEYLRITWQDMPDMWRLKNVTGFYTEKGAPAAREWLTLEPLVPDETGDDFYFNVSGSPPIDRVSVLLPNDNVVLRASVFHRFNPDDTWRHSASGIFYHVTRKGNVFETPALPISDTRTGEWKIHIDSGSATGPIRLQLGWRPDNLVFVAQGTPPFELVTGRAKDAMERYPQETILGDRAIFNLLRQSGEPGTAALGPRELIAGPNQLEPVSNINWRTLLLWIGLIIAVVVVGKMVLSLLSDLRKDDVDIVKRN